MPCYDYGMGSGILNLKFDFRFMLQNAIWILSVVCLLVEVITYVVGLNIWSFALKIYIYGALLVLGLFYANETRKEGKGRE